DGDHDDVQQQVQTPMGTARVFQLAEVLLECEGQPNRADSRYGHGGRRHDSPPWRARAEENGRGWSLTKSTSSEECGRSVRCRPCPLSRVQLQLLAVRPREGAGVSSRVGDNLIER